METLFDFRKRVSDTLAEIDPEALRFHEDEFWMIRAPYEFLEYYAEKNRLFNTALALPLARGLHDGSYRKLPITRNGTAYRPPYVIHCLTVCKMLADMWLPISNDEKDTLLAAALCHDMIEDLDFPQQGGELVTQYHLSVPVYKTVRLVSKRKDFTLREERAFFRKIAANRLALLIKLSDRGHNVTDLFNMSDRKIQEYIGETRTYFLPMCEYARGHYPELGDVIEILQDQLICLTKTVEMQAEGHAQRRQTLTDELQALRAENEVLRKQWMEIREGGICK